VEGNHFLRGLLNVVEHSSRHDNRIGIRSNLSTKYFSVTGRIIWRSGGKIIWRKLTQASTITKNGILAATATERSEFIHVTRVRQIALPGLRHLMLPVAQSLREEARQLS
jgi:hypothetical protein